MIYVIKKGELNKESGSMEDGRLNEVETILRSILIENNLEWIVDQVDTAISQGSVKEIPASEIEMREFGDIGLTDVRLSSLDYERRRDTSRTKQRSRTAPAVASRPLEPRERVEKLIDALYLVVTELPTIEKAAVKQLADQDQGMPPVTSITFVRDTESEDLGRRLSAQEEAEEQNRSLQPILVSLREEINS